jgi:hypothetical protein
MPASAFFVCRGNHELRYDATQEARLAFRLTKDVNGLSSRRPKYVCILWLGFTALTFRLSRLQRYKVARDASC